MPTRKRAPAPIARPTEARPLVGDRERTLPAYVAAMRSFKLALVLAPIGVAAAGGCSAGPTRYAGSAPYVQPPEPSASASTVGTASSTPSTSPTIAPSITPPPAPGGLRPTNPDET